MDSFFNFHFLRPLWFLAILPLAWLAYHQWKQRHHNSGLEKYINSELLEHLIIERQSSAFDLSKLGIFLAWLSIVFILAGPSWKQLPQPLLQSESAVIIALDLSPSMRAQDNKPSRIIRAQLKIQDVLNLRQDGLTALIVYGGEAHVVTPFTDDTKTISNLLAGLRPGILPVPGSNTEMAIRLGQDLMAQANLTKASILLVTDGVDPAAFETIANTLNNDIQLTILGIGTEAGAAIPNRGGFLQDENNNVIIAKRNSAVMQKFADRVNGYYLPIQNDGSDIALYQSLLIDFFDNNQKLNTSERQYDRWHEFGPTMILILLPLFACFYRRGLLLSVMIMAFSTNMLLPSTANASAWEWLWKNNNQRAQIDYEGEQYEDAAKAFSHKQWKASALYKNGDFNSALNYFSEDTTAIGAYNRGNALAQLKRYQDAITAYNQALAIDENLEAARKNKALIESLLKNQQQQDSSENANNQSHSDDQQSQQQHTQNPSHENKNASQGPSEQQPSDAQQGQSNNETNPDDNTDNGLNEITEAGNSNQQQTKQNNATTEQAQAEIDNNGNLQDLSAEERQAMEQWLRKIPDDPSGLLRNKFEYEYQKRSRLYQEGKWQLPDNNAHQRY